MLLTSQLETFDQEQEPFGSSMLHTVKIEVRNASGPVQHFQ